MTFLTSEAFRLSEEGLLNQMNRERDNAYTPGFYPSSVYEIGSRNTGFIVYLPQGLRVDSHIREVLDSLSKQVTPSNFLVRAPFHTVVGYSQIEGFSWDKELISMSWEKNDKLIEATYDGVMAFCRDVRAGRRNLPNIGFEAVSHDRATFVLKPTGNPDNVRDYFELTRSIWVSFRKKQIELEMARSRCVVIGHVVGHIEDSREVGRTLLESGAVNAWPNEDTGQPFNYFELDRLALGFFESSVPPVNEIANGHRPKFNLVPLLEFNLKSLTGDYVLSRG